MADDLAAIGLEEIIEFLNNHGVETEIVNKDEHGFSRTIKFNVYGIDYIIIWYSNQSSLHIGSHPRSARIPFKYMYLDDCYPLVEKNISIGFSYSKRVRKSFFDRIYPYEVFRIPLELKGESEATNG